MPCSLTATHHFTRVTGPGQCEQQGHHSMKPHPGSLAQPATMQFGIEPAHTRDENRVPVWWIRPTTNLPLNCRHAALPPSPPLAPVAMVACIKHRNSLKLLASLAGGQSSKTVVASVEWYRDSRFCSHCRGEDLQTIHFTIKQCQFPKSSSYPSGLAHSLILLAVVTNGSSCIYTVHPVLKLVWIPLYPPCACSSSPRLV